ncbi:MAG TPA: MerR family transcriptional regulator [Rhizomicrobium sp.]|nr:MerR family transcriptional regulator [Rhizomicrobium sp.]
MTQSYTMRQLTKLLGVTARTLRHYEEMRLIAPARRGETRIYSFRDYARILIALRGRRLGYSVTEMRDVLQMYEYKDSDVRDELLAARSKFLRRITDLKAKQRDIDESVQQLSECINQIDGALVGKPRTPWYEFFAFKMMPSRHQALQ